MSLSDTPANIPAAQAMQAVLEQALHPTLLQITDESALHAGHVHARVQGSHMRIRIVAPAFAGQTRVACHRLVYAVLRPFLDTGLHALAIEIEQP